MLLTLCCCCAPAITVKGVAVNCDFGPKAPVSMLSVRIFDAAKVPRLVASIKKIETTATGDSYEITRRTDAMLRTFRASTPISQTKTNRSGTFRMEIPNEVRQIIVFGYGEPEDYPYFFDYKQLAVSAGTTIDVMLDVPGYCASRK
jgi:hypothetical protein